MKRFVASVKNVPGRLSLGETDITWVPEQGGNANIVIPYTSLAELRKNAVKSGDPDAKVILRITTGGGEAGAAPTNYSIRFTSPAAEKDREAVISELTPRMRENREKQAGTPPSGPATPGSSGGGKHPAAGAKRPRSDGGGATGGPSKAEMDFRKEIELRQAVLREDKDLKALWEKLVFKGRLVNEEDFWRTRQHILRDYAWKKSQTKGLQSEVLKGLRPQDDNSSNKYSLTPEIIETILNLYPSVRKAYEQHVPKGASEDVQRAFWSKYLESNHYRQTLSSSMVEPRAHDLFDAYMDEERDDFEPHPKRIKHSAHHPLLDLTTTTEDHIESGNRPDSTMRAGREKIPLRMIRVMNRYSQTALKEDRGETSVLTANEADETLLQETELEDLRLPSEPDRRRLEIGDGTRFYEPQTQTSGGGTASNGATNVKSMVGGFDNSVESWTPNLTRGVIEHARLSDKVMGQLNEWTRKRRFESRRTEDNRFSADTELRSKHKEINELLAHFWATTTPPQTDEKAKKRQHIVTGLRQYSSDLGKPQPGQIGDPALIKAFLNPLATSIELALRKDGELRGVS